MTATITPQNAPPAPPPSAPAESDVPTHSDGLELLGRFEGSGFRDPPYLVRRGDGQVLQLSRLLYLVAEAADGRRDERAIATRVGRRSGRPVSAGNVRFIVDRKLRPLGVLAAADGSTPDLPKRPPLLALRHRRPLLSARTVALPARAFSPLFAPLPIAIVLVALVAFDTWLFGFHGIAPGLRSALYEPTLLLALVAAVIAATAFHEVGHAAACRYGGARPGAIGAGLYLVWPAFYCDVTDAYRLDRRGRLRTDLGGVYFNGIVALLAGGAYFATGQEALLLLAVVQHLTIVQQLLPLLRFDGYYVLSDLTGVPDILSRIGPILRSLVPFRRTDPKVRELKPWVRTVVTLYIALLVPLLFVLLGWMVMGAPRVFATAFDSLVLHAQRVPEAVRQGEWSVTGLLGLQLLMLVLQPAGIGLILARTARTTGRRLARWSEGSLARRAVAVAGGAAAVAFIVAVWWPNGDYQPLRPGERGTIPEGLSGMGQIAESGPAFTFAHDVGFAHLPTEREAGAPAPPAGSPDQVAPPADQPASDPEQDGDAGRPAPARPPDGETAPVPGDPERAAPRPADGAVSPAPAPSATPTPGPGSPATGGDNVALARNNEDGSLVFRLAFDLQFVAGGEIDQSNSALAYGNCTACRTIAVAIQVLIATSDIDVAGPTNLAVAMNDRCPSCVTLAYAYQLVLALPDVSGLSAEGRAKLSALLAAVVLVATSDAPIDDLRAQLDALMLELRHVVASELVPDAGEESPPVAPAGGTGAADTEPAAPDEAATQTPDPTATASPETPAPSPDGTTTPSPAPTATATATPQPTPEATATPTPDPTATASPEPTPDATASPSPTP